MTPATATATAKTVLPPVVLVGQPNVGKSALFSALTGAHAVVSNYPGTTVTVTSGRWLVGEEWLPVKDTPGTYSLLPVTDEERIARESLFAGEVTAVLHVVDAKNLDRSLGTTLELLDAGLPLVLVLNMIDEARAQGIVIDRARLQARLGCPVVETVAVERQGTEELRESVAAMRRQQRPSERETGRIWSEEFGPAVDRLAAMVSSDSTLPKTMPARVAAALAIRGSPELARRAGFPAEALQQARQEVREHVGGMPPVAAILALRARAAKILEGAFHRPATLRETLQHRLGIALAHPLWGLPALLFVLYVGFYWIVGQFAAGTLVGWLEEDLFGGYVNPVLERIFATLVPWDLLRALFVGEYGVFTLGITYALALVLPVVGAFFVVFSLVEDSGYFPRLALLCDRVFKRLGLNGRAVITMVLGLGCATMATVTTRTLETKRERILATLLLVLAIPCSAQLGLITALLAARGLAMWVAYVGCLLAVFVGVGWIAARVLPGRNATFHMEVPPMRVPRFDNVVKKTWMRLAWYFKEVVPLFLLASVLLWLLDQTGALKWIERGVEPVMAWIGLPATAAESFLVGFFRRDFGAAGLFKLSTENSAGLGLTDRQLLSGSLTLTLFVPCVASFMMMCKERGWRTGLLTFAAVTAIALIAGAGLNQALLALGWA